MLHGQQTHRTAAVLRLEQNYGSEGVTVRAAAMASAPPAQPIGIIGLLLMPCPAPGGGTAVTGLSASERDAGDCWYSLPV